MAKKKQPDRSSVGPADALLPAGYAQLLDDLRGRVRSAQLKAAVAVNAELIRLYWDVGRAVLDRRQAEGWGAKVIDRLGRDLQAGFSPRNLKYMRAFAEACPNAEIVHKLLHKYPDSKKSVFSIRQINYGDARPWCGRAVKGITSVIRQTDAATGRGRYFLGQRQALRDINPTHDTGHPTLSRRLRVLGRQRTRQSVSSISSIASNSTVW
jgi:hypothetical protein